MSDNQKINEVVDTTDSLEAIAAFKWMKNFLFLVIVICILVIQGAFWLNYTGYIDSAKAEDSAPAKKQVQLTPAPAEKTVEKTVSPETESEAQKAALTEIQAQKAVSDMNNEGTADEEAADNTASAEETVAENDSPAAEETETEKTAASSEKISLKQEHVAVAVKISNFVLVLTATLYSLVLLMSLKISLAGRLGGISHISRAFFLSLFALVILLPWQKMFPGVVVGAMFTPAELFDTPVAVCGSEMFCQITYFARFTGMWLIAALFLFAAQIRTARWSKTTLKRLGMLR